MIYESVQKLIDYALQNELMTDDDVFVVRNQLMDALCLSDWEETDARWNGESIDSVLGELVGYACESGIIRDTVTNRDLFDTKLMGILTPMPREISKKFQDRLAVSPEEATRWYYGINKKLNYVREERIAKDVVWKYECEYGTLDITINRSKPEKDPRDIAAAKESVPTAYPKCLLCAENAGFSGNVSQPARQNLRPVPVKVGGEEWQMQYSPYGYYNEHCIFLNKKHVPMVVDGLIFGKLFDVLDYLPHYFVGSNADLPIVGGSILSHEHFQGGNYDFAMAKAPVETKVIFPGYPDVNAGVVKWPMSVIRVSSENRKKLEDCCRGILSKWREYSDESVSLYAYTGGVPHNTVTPIARKNGKLYECDLVLRNNLTTEERPLGLFHPKPSLHHIKKENIGLIEVMGLAVLPGRLAAELEMLGRVILTGESLDTPELSQHADWARNIIENHPEITAENVTEILRQETGKVFLDVLKDAGVFKRDAAGRNAFMKFINTVK